MCSGEKRPAGNTAVWSRGLTKYERISARQNRVCLVKRWYCFLIKIFDQKGSAVGITNCVILKGSRDLVSY